MHDIALPSEKVVSPVSGEKYAQTKHHLQTKTVQDSFKQICCLMLEHKRMDFFTGGIIIMDYGLVFWRRFKVKTL